MGARLRCAWLTIFTICASNVSLPTRSARITSEPVPFTVAPITALPGPLLTGIDSPVIIDSSIPVVPSSTIPSTGTFSPGRTRKRSPGLTCSSGISSSRPSRKTRAIFGVRSSKARIAAPVRLRARNSSTCPNSTNVVIAAAASKYTAGIPPISRNDAGNICGKTVATRL